MKSRVPNKSSKLYEKVIKRELDKKRFYLPLVNNNHGSKLTVCKTAYWCKFHVLKLNATLGNVTCIIQKTHLTSHIKMSPFKYDINS